MPCRLPTNSADEPSYDVETNAGGFETWSGSGSYLYYAAFEVDVSQLVFGWQVHFDLYNSSTFAPYSHDTYANPPGKPPGEGVPEPATMLLFGTGLAGLAGYHRKRKAAN